MFLTAPLSVSWVFLPWLKQFVCFSADTLSVLLSQLSDEALVPIFVHCEESMCNFPLWTKIIHFPISEISISRLRLSNFVPPILFFFFFFPLLSSSYLLTSLH